MQRPRLIAFCVFLMLMLFGSSIVFSQSVNDAYHEFLRANQQEFYSQTHQERWNEYGQFSFSLFTETHENIQARVDQRKNILGENPSLEESEKYFIDVVFDLNAVKQKMLNDKIKELFPDAQAMQQRRFQLHESLMRQLKSSDNAEDIYFTSNMLSLPPNEIFNTQPDFLELSPEQTKLMNDLQKEMVLKIRLLQASVQQDDVLREIGQLVAKQLKATPEEKEELEQRMKKISMDMYKGIIPQLKDALIEGHENYMRVLTDAQKAKIKSVMDDMPDYMKNLFAAIDKQGGGLSILHNWQPGMGVPDYPNPNREAPRERTNTGGGRAFPGE